MSSLSGRTESSSLRGLAIPTARESAWSSSRGPRDRSPVLGVCLGHQSIGQAFGGRIVRAPEIMHGKLSVIRNDGTGVFAGLPSEFRATRYHSLTIDRDSMPDSLRVTAETGDGTVMGVAHREFPIHGVQFHPESIASEHGHAVLANFLGLTGMDGIRPMAAASPENAPPPG